MLNGPVHHSMTIVTKNKIQLIVYTNINKLLKAILGNSLRNSHNDGDGIYIY